MNYIKDNFEWYTNWEWMITHESQLSIQYQHITNIFCGNIMHKEQD